MTAVVHRPGTQCLRDASMGRLPNEAMNQSKRGVEWAPRSPCVINVRFAGYRCCWTDIRR